MDPENISSTSRLLSTGVAGLDEILNGGLQRERTYILDGDPGAGKTTLSLQFLMEGVRNGEGCMIVSLSESKEELQASAVSHGWSLEGIHVHEIIPSEESLQREGRYTMFHPSEVELDETTRSILSEVERIQPARLVVDSLSEFRLLAENQLRYRRQILALKQRFGGQHCTVLFIDDRIHRDPDKQLHSLAHGVLRLDRQSMEYGTIRCRVIVSKMRGQRIREGYHDFRIRRGGLEVYPRLVASDFRTTMGERVITSGSPAFDALLGGGVMSGTMPLIVGAAGTGKSSLAAHFALASLNRGESVAVFLFDESLATFLERNSGLGVDVAPYIETGKLRVRQLDPAELSAGEFLHSVRTMVTEENCQLVIIDSLNGFMHAMPNDEFLVLHLRELLSFLGHRGVTALMTITQHGIVDGLEVPLDVSYVADTVVLLRYFEASGEVRKAISVIKKRTGKHDRTLREFYFDKGIALGEPLRDFHGILTGVPEYLGRGLRRHRP